MATMRDLYPLSRSCLLAAAPPPGDSSGRAVSRPRQKPFPFLQVQRTLNGLKSIQSWPPALVTSGALFWLCCYCLPWCWLESSEGSLLKGKAWCGDPGLMPTPDPPPPSKRPHLPRQVLLCGPAAASNPASGPVPGAPLPRVARPPASCRLSSLPAAVALPF